MERDGKRALFMVCPSADIASGFIAGGTLMGVASTLMKFGGIECSIADTWWTNPLSEVCSLVAYICLITYFIKATK